VSNKTLGLAISEHFFGTEILVLENPRTGIPVPAQGLTYVVSKNIVFTSKNARNISVRVLFCSCQNDEFLPQNVQVYFDKLIITRFGPKIDLTK
jgi:hypothetical protein